MCQKNSVHFALKKSHCRTTGLQDFTCVGESNLVASMNLTASLVVKLDLVRETGTQDAEQCFYGFVSEVTPGLRLNSVNNTIKVGNIAKLSLGGGTPRGLCPSQCKLHSVFRGAKKGLGEREQTIVCPQANPSLRKKCTSLASQPSTSIIYRVSLLCSEQPDNGLYCKLLWSSKPESISTVTTHVVGQLTFEGISFLLQQINYRKKNPKQLFVAIPICSSINFSLKPGLS